MTKLIAFRMPADLLERFDARRGKKPATTALLEAVRLWLDYDVTKRPEAHIAPDGVTHVSSQVFRPAMDARVRIAAVTAKAPIGYDPMTGAPIFEHPTTIGERLKKK